MPATSLGEQSAASSATIDVGVIDSRTSPLDRKQKPGSNNETKLGNCCNAHITRNIWCTGYSNTVRGRRSPPSTKVPRYRYSVCAEACLTEDDLHGLNWIPDAPPRRAWSRQKRQRPFSARFTSERRARARSRQSRHDASHCPTHVSVSFSPAEHQDHGRVCEDVRCTAMGSEIN